MNKWNHRRRMQLLSGLAALCVISLLGSAVDGISVSRMLSARLGEAVNGLFLPAVTGVGQSLRGWIIHSQTEMFLPLYGIAEREFQYREQKARSNGARAGTLVKEDDTHARVLTYEGVMADEDIQETQKEAQQEMSGSELELPAYVETEKFVPHTLRQEVDLNQYEDYAELVKEFYTIDASTMAGEELLNVGRLSGRDMSIQPARENMPQILIYHTHSQEAYADSAEGDAATSVVGVGEYLARILHEEYGYQVLHCTESFDRETRNDAYGRALPVLQEILAENPSIQVVIDLHRDEMPVHTRLVTEIDGRPTARFMFFNGLSRMCKTGEIAYLKNENLEGNLAFSFQMQVKCAEYYPGLARKIYLKGYRYNMHLLERSLLVELGAQNNTVEEAMNACEPLAHVLNMVLREAS